jgi:hypothetical protein
MEGGTLKPEFNDKGKKAIFSWAFLILGHKYDKLGLECHSVDIYMDSYPPALHT